ncbi:MAG: small conductance mechanosensitive channel [Hydrogenophaga sp.]
MKRLRTFPTPLSSPHFLTRSFVLSELNSERVTQLAVQWGGQFLLALLVLGAGLWLTGWIARHIDQRMEKLGLEITLRHFLCSLIGLSLKVLVIITVASMLGVATTSFIAVLGAAGLAVGLALQGSLSNFAGGVLLILFKPYKVGDYVEMQGVSGSVYGIQLLYTVLRTPDNKEVFVPNGPVANGNIVNYSTQLTRRVDMQFGIGYSSSIDLAKTTLTELLQADVRVLSDPPVQIVVAELADNSVNLKVRAWTASADYWGVFFDMQEAVKKRFDAVGLEIPFPQRDVHLHTVKD